MHSGVCLVFSRRQTVAVVADNTSFGMVCVQGDRMAPAASFAYDRGRTAAFYNLLNRYFCLLFPLFMGFAARYYRQNDKDRNE